MKPARNSIIFQTISLKLIVLLFSLFPYCNLIYANEQLPGIGAMGDSLTDEYSQRASNYGDPSALNWVDLLARLRGPGISLPELTFGDYQTNSAVWGSPRYGGYENNFALWGENTTTLLSRGQHTGIAAHIRAGQVRYVAVFIGTNDFQPASSYGMYEAIYNDETPFTGCDGKSYASVQDYADSIVERYTIALEAVLDAGGQPVMATIVDFGMAPRTASAQGYTDPDKRQNVTDAVLLVNDGLKSLAVAESLPIVKMFELFHRFVVDPEPSFVGDISIIKGAAPNPDGRYVILPDGAHPGTVLQGLLANAFIEACNRSYGTNFTPLSDQEILASAGISVPEGDVTFFDVTPYVIIPTLTKYSGGTGEPNDPYQIATAEDLMLLGESIEDYDKHFILTADIDLDPNLPGRKVFDKAVIAPDVNDSEGYFQGTPFTGIFDGNDHTFSQLTITGKDYLGLFGCLGPRAEIRNLYIVDVNITGSGEFVGAMVGRNEGYVTRCNSTGTVSGNSYVGGLMGTSYGIVSNCSSTSMVTGIYNVGGLTGGNERTGSIARCYAISTIKAEWPSGGLVGLNAGYQNPEEVLIIVADVADCYSIVLGNSKVSGLLVGKNGAGGELVPIRPGRITNSYASCEVSGMVEASGLVGYNFAGEVLNCFWDAEASRLPDSAEGGTPKTTSEMQDIQTYINAGWDFLGKEEDGLNEIWQMPQEIGYPILSIFNGHTTPKLQGLGTAEEPYIVSDSMELGAIINYSPYAHFRLVNSIDLSDICWSTPVIPRFLGTFDGNGHTISNLKIEGAGYLGLFGQLAGDIIGLGVVDVNITSSGDYIGGLIGCNKGGNVTDCYVTGLVSGGERVGGLIGYGGFYCTISKCYSISTVSGTDEVGGLVGYHIVGTVSQCYSDGILSGHSGIGGLVGYKYSGEMTDCHATCSVSGREGVGGLVGWYCDGRIINCYSTGEVGGTDFSVGGLIGRKWDDTKVTSCFWDIQTSGQATSDGGTGKTTSEIQIASTFLEAGWDFVNETENGTENIWWIDEGNDYPRLWWELTP